MAGSGPVSDRGVSAARRDPFHDWVRLMREQAATGALDVLASWQADGSAIELFLESASEPASGPALEIARTSAGGTRGEGDGHCSAIVDGVPVWRLRGRDATGILTPVRLGDLAHALSAWRAARVEIARLEGRLESRTEELEALHTLSRRCSEAGTPSELFRCAASLLHERGGLEAFVIAHTLDGAVEIRVFLGRPVDQRAILDAAERTAAELDQKTDIGTAPLIERLDRFDESQGLRRDVGKPPLIPIRRRGRVVACVSMVPLDEPGESQLRLLYGAANHLSLHIERLLMARESEQGRFRSVLESMPQAVILADTDLKVVLDNPAAARLMARLPGGAGRALDVLGDLDLRTLAAPVRERRIPSAAAEAHLDDGRILGVTVSASLDRAEGQAGLVLVLTDVTDDRKLHEQLARAEKLSSLGQMISGVTHELNNPLASVLGYSQLIARQVQDKKLASRLDLIHQEARRCQRIVQNLLSFARRHDPERKRMSVNEVVSSVAQLMEYTLRVDGLRLVTELEPELPSILGDHHQLQQVLVNLISNAQHAMRNPNRSGCLHIRTRRMSNERVVLEVQDEGPGVPESIRSLIFDPFFTTKPTGEGTGLGLSLVYGIVTSHGGTVHVDNGDTGAIFRIELPQAHGDAAAEKMLDASTPEPAGPPGRILVVDDEDPITRVVCEALAVDGHRTVAARSGREALARLAIEEFDLVVSDVKMPDMGAQRLHREMEWLRPGLARRLLLTTGDTFSDETDKFARRHRLEVLHKPFDLDDLRRLVRVRLASQRRA